MAFAIFKRQASEVGIFIEKKQYTMQYSQWKFAFLKERSLLASLFFG
jgi:hypothetical protein